MVSTKLQSKLSAYPLFQEGLRGSRPYRCHVYELKRERRKKKMAAYLLSSSSQHQQPHRICKQTYTHTRQEERRGVVKPLRVVKPPATSRGRWADHHDHPDDVNVVAPAAVRVSAGADYGCVYVIRVPV